MAWASTGTSMQCSTKKPGWLLCVDQHTTAACIQKARKSGVSCLPPRRLPTVGCGSTVGCERKTTHTTSRHAAAALRRLLAAAERPLEEDQLTHTALSHLGDRCVGALNRARLLGCSAGATARLSLGASMMCPETNSAGALSSCWECAAASRVRCGCWDRGAGSIASVSMSAGRSGRELEACWWDCALCSQILSSRTCRASCCELEAYWLDCALCP